MVDPTSDDVYEQDPSADDAPPKVECPFGCRERPRFLGRRDRRDVYTCPECGQLWDQMVFRGPARQGGHR